jgi:AcrR family transcriptional regulator
VQKTQRSLHEALFGLVREKDYDDIPVHDILERANVGRSTFYAHFGGKDELLASGIEHMVTRSDRRSMTSFSLTVFEHHDQHRRTGSMTPKTLTLLHDRLRAVVAERVREDVQQSMWSHPGGPIVPVDLLAQFVASTFVVVLDWWLDTRSPLAPAEVNDLFCSLVARALQGRSDKSQPRNC